MVKPRKKFFKEWGNVELQNLIQIQTNSYKEFLQRDIFPEKRKKQGLQELFESFFPILSFDERTKLEFISYRFVAPKYSIEDCLDKGLTYEAALHVLFRLSDDVGVREEEVFVGYFPLMADVGSFIINGSERVLVAQIHRSPGIYFEKETSKNKKDNKVTLTFKIMPYRGSWLVAEIDSNDLIHIYMERNKKRRRVLATTFLRAIGLSTNVNILEKFFNIVKVKVNGEEDLDKVVGCIVAKAIRDEEGSLIIADGDNLTIANVMHALRVGIHEFEIADGATSFDPIIKMIRGDTNNNHKDALKHCFRKMYPDEPATLSNARFGLMRFFFDKNRYNLGEVGRYKINKSLGLPLDEESLKNTLLTQDDIVLAIKKMLAIKNKEEGYKTDDIDDLANRRVRLCGELVSNQCRMAFLRMEKIIKEKMSILDSSNDNVTPGRLISSKMLTVVLKELFARSQLSQFMDQANPLAEISHKRRLSALGAGGIQRERAGLEVRDVHPSHYGKICPVETPEGPSIGLITSLAIYSKINRFGFIETPYFEVKNGRLSEDAIYCSSDDERGKYIAQSIVEIDEKGNIVPKTCLVRRDAEIMEVSSKEVQLIEVSSSQIFSAGTNLIPFLEHDDTNRALMGSNMQKQAVPVIKTEAPIVGTGIEARIAEDSKAVIVAEVDGIVKYADAKTITIEASNKDDNDQEITLRKFKRSNNGLSINYRVKVSVNQKVKKGDVLADGPASHDGEISFGKNIFVAFMPFFGGNFEDAIVISESLVKNDVFTAVRIEKLEMVARDTKLGEEEITRDIPNVSEESLKNLDDDGIIKVGARVSPGDVIVGKVTPKLEGDLSPEERFLRAIFKDKAQNVKDTSLVAPVGVGGVVVDVKVFSRKDRVNRTDSIIQAETAQIKAMKKAYIVEKEEIIKTSKNKVKEVLLGLIATEVIANRVSGEAIIDKGEKITEEVIDTLIKIGYADILDIGVAKYIEARSIIQDLEKDIETLSIKHSKIVTEIKKGDSCLDSGVLKHIIVHIANKSPLEVGDKMAGRHGNKGVLSSIVPVEDMPFMDNGVPVDMILNPLGVPSRMNIGQIAETHLGWIGQKTGINLACPVFRGCKEEQIFEMMRECGLPEDGKVALYNGRTGERFINKVLVGYMYILRLNHFITDKMHARSTGPYSFITQQPLGGKSRFGGQRFGEMEFWAAEAYGAANFLLEMLTVKSDDVMGRTMIYQNIVKGEPVLKTTQTESLRVLIKEIMGLCLDVRLENSDEDTKEKSSSQVLASGATDKEDQAEGEFEQQCNKFDKLTLRLASEDVIRNSWSHGEVKKAETINYRTMRPERGGLFCEKIFGPTKDWECACGKHKKVKHKSVICDRCGVEVNVARVRRERMGHIDLVIPIVHIWLLKNVPSRLGHLVGMQVTQLESIVYYEQYVVIDPKNTNLLVKQTLSHQEYQSYVDRYGADAFEAKLGGEAIKELLKREDLHAVENELKQAIKKARSLQARMKLARRLRTIDGFLKSGNSIDSLVLSCVPVIPPDIRPLIKLEGGRFATSDINDLYRRLLYRNERLKQIVKMSKTPEVIVRNEMRLLQEAVDGVFDNGRRNTAIAGSSNKILKPIAQSLRGKHGRFRQNLLGKRVDYSGRSVIVVGPELKINQCGLPKEMAIQMFEPFIVRQLRIRGKARTIRSARRTIQKQTKEVWEIIESIIENHAVVLNRAPTLHRLSIQAFKPVLVEGKAIRLHPLVCAAFNADFDGDQMAVHVPLSIEAQIETKMFMMSADNIFLPASGKPIAMPTRDMTLGVYSLMIDPIYIPEKHGEKVKTFSSLKEALFALHSNDDGMNKRLSDTKYGDFLEFGIFLHEKICVRVGGVVIDTTPGRVLFDTVVPSELGFQNYSMSQGKLSDLIMICHEKLGLERTVKLLDDLKDIGFAISTSLPTSMGLGDICRADNKQELLTKASKQVRKITEQLNAGIITEGEAESRTIGVWTSVSDEISKELFKNLIKMHENRMNPLNIILESGARGNKSQIRQLGGMRGLVAKPSGEIITFPVRSCFREGLSPIEFFISTHGGRKGLADTALKTADAGYLTRRLVDVAQEIVVKANDCGSISGIKVSPIQNMQEEILTLKSRISGRYAAEDIVSPNTNTPIVKEGELIDDKIAEIIDSFGVESVEIRSPLTCLIERGVCAKCYGKNLADGKVAIQGETVGIIAAQSIGEPGTQLTMRTFHMGGVASMEVDPAWISDKEGIVVYDGLRYVVVSDTEVTLVGRSGRLCIVEDLNRSADEYVELLRNKTIVPLREFKGDIGAKILVQHGAKISKGVLIANIEADNLPIIAEQSGIVVYEDLIEGVTLEKIVKDKTKQSGMLVKHYREGVCPNINIVDDTGKVLGSYYLPPGAIISAKEGELLAVGDYIARIPRSALKTQDITGGLARVAEIFEARKPQNPAEIAAIEGIVAFRGSQKGKRIISVVDADNPEVEFEHPISLKRQLIVHKGDRVYAGQQLTNGIASFEEILKICGIKYLQRQLVDQIQEVYRLQGVEINDKHIEIIIRRMMNKLSIIDHGDATSLIFGDEVTRKEFEDINRGILQSGGRPAKAAPMLSGITQAALNTKSIISAAAFQNPTQGLLEGAMRGSTDYLLGCKENIIVANKMPAGTGFIGRKHGEEVIHKCDFNDEMFKDDETWEIAISDLESCMMNLTKEDIPEVEAVASIVEV